MPGRYEDPSASGTFQRKVVTFKDQDTEDNTEQVVEIHDNQESYPLIQVHEEPVATSAPKPTTSAPKPTTFAPKPTKSALKPTDRPYLQMRPKLPPKKKPVAPKSPSILNSISTS